VTAADVGARTAGGDSPLPPGRISFNFTDRCNMACRFCYIPFDGVRVDANRAARVIDIVMSWSPASITVGGGDPLMYPFTVRLLRQIRHSAAGDPPFIQLDSNLVRSRRHNLAALADCVDMLGVPVDTFDPHIALQMRGNHGHPAEMRALIPALLDAGLCVKLNTTVALPNLGCLGALADFVAESGVRAWSLYEFWAVGPTAIQNRQSFAVDHNRFLAAVAAAASRAAHANVETGTISSRRSAYFFVTPSGRAYTVDGSDPTRYAELGNVIDDEDGVLRRWHQHADAGWNTARVRARAQWAEQSAATPAIPEPSRI
jgi:MoaA/NifB/PqqE/SkfB family radical SAM enzyme